MKKGKLILIVTVILLVIGSVLFLLQPRGVAEHTAVTNVEILEEMQIEGENRIERIDSLNRTVDSIRGRKVVVDSTDLDSMLRFLRGLRYD